MHPHKVSSLIHKGIKVTRAMALIIILSKVVVKQLAYEQTIIEQTLAGILMKTRVGSTSIPVSLNPSNSMLFQIQGFRIPLRKYAWKVRVWRE